LRAALASYKLARAFCWTPSQNHGAGAASRCPATIVASRQPVVSMSPPLPLVVIVGPTAVGKTGAAVMLAEKLHRAEIVSADSRQIYRGMDIGTAKPTARDRRVRHHLLDIRDPGQRYSAGEFARDAWDTLRELAERGAVPVVVGGSGLYVQALLDGLAPVAEAPGARSQIRERLSTEGTDSLYERLGRLDPAAAHRIAATDRQRITRAIELVLLGACRGRPWVSGRASPRGCAPLIYVCLSRERASLYARIDRRVEDMVRAGLLDEVQQLRQRGYGADAPGLQTLGYAEALAHLEGATDLETMIRTVQQQTRRYAKRQLTWFGRDRRLRWLDMDRHGPRGCVERILAQIAAETGG